MLPNWLKNRREKRDEQTKTEGVEFLRDAAVHVSREWMRSYLIVYNLNKGYDIPIEMIDAALDKAYGRKP